MIHLVGDVQGCDSALGRLLETIGFSPSRDRVVLLGDLVNRGPSSLAVLRRIAALGDSAACILGNHDLHLLAVAYGTRKAKSGDTFADVLADPNRVVWVDWLRAQALARVEGGWLCVHAGVAPQWSAAQTLALSDELQTVLRSTDLASFLPAMYGNLPARWSDDLQGTDRLRCAINVFTRMRFCSADGSMDFDTKEGASGAPAGKLPWFDVPGRLSADQPIAFGHWSTLGLINSPRLLALDTGCVWGGALSAMRVDGGRRELMQIACAAEQQPGL
jgi:bis(5'-nucleosyl)-tetraphosphatase (symmetrical)